MLCLWRWVEGPFLPESDAVGDDVGTMMKHTEIQSQRRDRPGRGRGVRMDDRADRAEQGASRVMPR